MKTAAWFRDMIHYIDHFGNIYKINPIVLELSKNILKLTQIADRDNYDLAKIWDEFTQYIPLHPEEYRICQVLFLIRYWANVEKLVSIIRDPIAKDAGKVETILLLWKNSIYNESFDSIVRDVFTKENIDILNSSVNSTESTELLEKFSCLEISETLSDNNINSEKRSLSTNTQNLTSEEQAIFSPPISNPNPLNFPSIYPEISPSEYPKLRSPNNREHQILQKGSLTML